MTMLNAMRIVIEFSSRWILGKGANEEPMYEGLPGSSVARCPGANAARLASFFYALRSVRMVMVLGLAVCSSIQVANAADYGLVRYQAEERIPAAKGESSPRNNAAAHSAPQHTSPTQSATSHNVPSRSVPSRHAASHNLTAQSDGVPDFNKPGIQSDSGVMYSEGDIIYEGSDGPMGMHPFDDFLGSPDCGYGCPPSWTATGDAFYLSRSSDGNSSLSTGFRLDDFDYDTAGRYTIAHRFDCLIGWEAAYFGPFEWTQANAVAGAGIDPRIPLAGLTSLNLSAFNNAVGQAQLYNSRLETYEFSQKWWGWDVITTQAGVKFIDIEEDLFFNSENNIGETGTLITLTNNQLFGGQVGMDLILPVGRFSTTTRLRGGIYANFMDASTLITNAGAVEVNSFEERVDFAAEIQIGYHIAYYLTPRIAVRAGYETTWLYGLALAPDNLTNLLSAGDENVDPNGDVFFHGASAGVEINW